MNNTKIEWCDCTVNPVVGCTYGCPFCYARRLNQRFGYIDDFAKPQFFPERLKQLDSKNPKIIFMDSMSDIADWKPKWVKQVHQAIKKNPQHKYLFLTKRPLSSNFIVEKSTWNGVSITKKSDIGKFGLLPADTNNFISIEPILEDLRLKECNIILNYAMWVIIGAETGNRKGKVIPKREWIEPIVNECRKNNIPVFMKGSLKDIWGEPLIQEFPESFNGEDK